MSDNTDFEKDKIKKSETIKKRIVKNPKGSKEINKNTKKNIDNSNIYDDNDVTTHGNEEKEPLNRIDNSEIDNSEIDNETYVDPEEKDNIANYDVKPKTEEDNLEAEEDSLLNEKDNLKPEENNTNDDFKKRERIRPEATTKDVNPDESQGGNKDKSKIDQVKELADSSSEEDKAPRLIEEQQKAIRLIKNTSKAISLFAKLLLNPITIGALIMIIVIMLVTSIESVVGKNDYNILCAPDGVGVVQISSDADAFTRQSAIVAWLTSTPFEKFGNVPMTREQAIGVIGNIAQESYQGNPRAIQGNHDMTAWETCNNDCVAGWGTTNGKAVGIVQWDGLRRQEFIAFAKAEGEEWYNLNIQLKFLKYELDGYEGANLVNGGFANLTHSIEDYVSIWNLKFERSAASGTEEGDRPRINYANAFASKYTDGSGLAMNCIGGSVNTSNLIQLALSSAYSREEALQGLGFGSCSQIGNCGQTFSKEEYKQANLIAYEKTGPDPSRGTLASCDRFVATMIRATGVDENFPWGSTANQNSYLNSNSDWQKVSCADRQPGDVLMWRPPDGSGFGHVMLYVGIVDGKDSLASASIAIARGGRSAQVRNVSCRGSLFNGDGVNAQGWRKVN